VIRRVRHVTVVVARKQEHPFPAGANGRRLEDGLSKTVQMPTLKRINNYGSEVTVSHAGIVVAVTRRIITDG
jgi:hypothetical protein